MLSWKNIISVIMWSSYKILYRLRKSKARVGLVINKIDLTKAYNNVSWCFLNQCMTEIVLPTHLIALIMNCVLSMYLSILWNGNKSESFHPMKGLRQGNPLSFLFFVICMEKLVRTINRKMSKGVWKPISLFKNGPRISNLFFVDDILFFYRAVLDSADTIKTNRWKLWRCW